MKKFPPTCTLLLATACLAIGAFTAFATTSDAVPPIAPDEKTGPAFSMEKWQAQYGSRMDMKQWYKRDPLGWGSYFDGSSPAVEKGWFFQLGPLGVRVAWRDATRSDSAFVAAFPEALRNNGLPLANAIEVLDVSADGPAAGQLQKGDLIVAIDGQPIRSAQYTFFDRVLACRCSRMLEIHAGQLIDAAEGNGRIRLTVLRGASAPTLADTEIPATSAAARSQSVEASLAGAPYVSLVAESAGSNHSCWVNWIAPRLEGPAGTLDLSKVPPVSATNGNGAVRYGTDTTGKPVKFNGQPAASVIGAHANTVITWAVPAGYTTLKATVQTPQNIAVKCRVNPHAAKPLEQWIPICEQEVPKPNPKSAATDVAQVAPPAPAALPLKANLPAGGVLCLAATGPAQFEGVQLKDAAGHSLALTSLKPAFNSYGTWPADGRLNGPFQFEFRLPPGAWTLSGSVRAPREVAVKCGVFPPLALPPALAAAAKEIAFDIPRLGSFGGKYDPDNAKLKNYSAMLAARLAAQQLPSGAWEGVPGSYAENAFHSCFAALGLMATGDPAYDENVRRTAHWIASGDFSLGYGGRTCTWCYPQGVKLMFLSEYYLRTGDKTVVPAIQEMVNLLLRTCLTVDYVAGHKMNTPGYQGSGWIGATGPILLGLATASHTPAKVDPKVLDGMISVMQEFGATYGSLPYYRGGEAHRYPPRTEAAGLGKGYNTGNGPYVLAALMGAGDRDFAQHAMQRFGHAPWGDEDAGHATHTLSYIWSSVVDAMAGPQARSGNMEAFFWRLTLLRDYAGFINHNNNALEFHGAEGVIGKPFTSTGGVLLVLNAHKKNLFMTGLEKYRTPPREVPFTQMFDRRFHLTTLNDWNIVEAALPAGAPAPMKAALAKLRALPENGPGMGDQLFAFLRTDAPSAAAAVLNMPGVKEPLRSWCAEMLLGVQDYGNYFSLKKKPEPSAEVAEYTFDPRMAVPHAAWGEDKPPLASQWSGTVTLSDPAGKYLAKPVVVQLTPGKKILPATVLLPVKAYPLVATYDYTLEGVHIRYQRPMNAVPANDHECCRLFLVRGASLDIREGYAWRWPFKLATGGLLEATHRESKQILIRQLDGKTKVFSPAVMDPGMPYELLVGEPNHWGEAPVYEVRQVQ